MKHFKKILATTDLSSESLSTVRYAAHLAKAQDASLVVLHVPTSAAMLYPDTVVPMDLTPLLRQVEAASREQLEHWLEHNARDVPVQSIVRYGITHETICEVAKEVGANLIVMSTHGRKGLGHVLLGSVTERVLRDAPCPVLVVRPVHEAKSTSKRAGDGKSKKAA